MTRKSPEASIEPKIACSCGGENGAHLSGCPFRTGEFDIIVDPAIGEIEKQEKRLPADVANAMTKVDQAKTEIARLTIEELAIRERLGQETNDRLARWNKTLASISRKVSDLDSHLKKLSPRGSKYQELSSQLERLLTFQNRIHDALSQGTITPEDEMQLETEGLVLSEKSGVDLSDELKLASIVHQRTRAEKIINELFPLINAHQQLEVAIITSKQPEDAEVEAARFKKLETEVNHAGEFFASVKEAEDARTERRQELKEMFTIVEALRKIGEEIFGNEQKVTLLPEEKAAQEVKRRELRAKRDELIAQFREHIERVKAAQNTKLNNFKNRANGLTQHEMSTFDKDEFRKFDLLDLLDGYTHRGSSEYPKELYDEKRWFEKRKFRLSTTEREDTAIAGAFGSLADWSAWTRRKDAFLGMKVDEKLLVQLEAVGFAATAATTQFEEFRKFSWNYRTSTDNKTECTIPIVLQTLGSHAFDWYIDMDSSNKYKTVYFKKNFLPEQQPAAAIFMMDEYLHDELMTAEGLNKRIAMFNNLDTKTPEMTRAMERISEMLAVELERNLAAGRYDIAAELLAGAAHTPLPAWLEKSEEQRVLFEKAKQFQDGLSRIRQPNFTSDKYSEYIRIAKSQQEAGLDATRTFKRALDFISTIGLKTGTDSPEKIQILAAAAKQNIKPETLVSQEELNTILDVDLDSLDLLYQQALLFKVCQREQRPVLEKIANILVDIEPKWPYIANPTEFEKELDECQVDKNKLLECLQTQPMKTYFTHWWLALLKFLQGQDLSTELSLVDVQLDQRPGRPEILDKKILNARLAISLGLNPTSQIANIEQQMQEFRNNDPAAYSMFTNSFESGLAVLKEKLLEKLQQENRKA